MTRLIDRVRRDLSELADSHPVPDGLAERAMAAGYRRRRRRAALAGGVALVAAAAVVLPFAALAVDRPSPPSAGAGRNAVFAQQAMPTREQMNSPDTVPPPAWRILDPRTGGYRTAAVGAVSMPSDDLRYAVVIPPVDDAAQARIGRYETLSGKIRWYDAPPPAVDLPQISPDGSRAGYWVHDPGTGEAEMALVDLRNGRVTPIDVPAGLMPERTRVKTLRGRELTSYALLQSRDPFGWLLENDRLVVGGVILDLSGRRTGTVPLPEKSVPIAVRPGGGTLVQPDGELGVYALIDTTGAVTGRVPFRSCVTADNAMCVDDIPSFHGWRGTDQILVRDLGNSSGRQAATILDAIDLHTGERHTVYVKVEAAVGRLVVIPADNLPGELAADISF